MGIGARFSGVLLALGLFALILGTGPARAEDPAKVMIVLDASGSMWGRINDQPKIAIARQAVAKLLKGWDRNIQLGLSAYGHRTKGDCNDIETLYKVGPPRPNAIMQAVNALKPKGKTPLSDAVRRAAEELRFTEDKATVILISDGMETCDADPCAIGKQLEKLGVDFTAHVIGFGLRPGEQKGLQCLARNTGGLYISAKNASGLNKALAATVKKVKAEQKVVIAKAVAQKKAAVKPGQVFRALLIEGGKLIKKGMRWDIYDAQANAAGKRRRIKGTYNPQPKFVLQPGKYVAVAKIGNATASHEFEVKSESENKLHLVIFNAGKLALKATWTDGGQVSNKGMRWDIYAPQANAAGKRPHINGNYNSQPLFTLPQGEYFVVAKRGNAVVSGTVAVKAGERTQKTFVLNAGLAVFEALFSEGGKPITKGMRWDVYGLENDLSGRRKRLNGNYNAAPTFVLPAGKFRVVAKRGNAVLARDIEVKPGKRTQYTFVLGSGVLALSARLADGKDIVKRGMRWDVYETEKDLEGRRKRLNGNYNPTPRFSLSKGKFLVIAKIGAAVKSATVEIKPGKLTEYVMILNAGQVKLVAIVGGQEKKKGLRWDVYGAEKDLEGRRKHFGGNYSSSPIFTLPAGKYVIALKIGGKVSNAPLTVNPGDSKRVDVTVE